jgi:manganese/zinc/iron transport system substrate-binding protein
MGAGVDPHLFRASPTDLSVLQSADWIFAHGHGLEGPLAQALEAVAKRRLGRVVFLGQEVPRQHWISHNGVVDPHLWMDPELWALSAERVGRSLARVESAQKHASQLRKLQLEVAEQLKSIPSERRVLITPHNGFAYFARRFGFETHSLLGSSTENQLSLNVVQSLRDRILKDKIPSVFFESAIHPSMMKNFAEQARVQLLGPLYSDSLGLDAATQTYVDMMKYNASLMRKGLGPND